jgi:tryptophan synthase beta chain
MEGILPALEAAHAIAYLRKIAPEMAKEQIVVLNVSGRGDKDAPLVADLQKPGKKKPAAGSAPQGAGKGKA